MASGPQRPLAVGGGVGSSSVGGAAADSVAVDGGAVSGGGGGRSLTTVAGVDRSESRLPHLAHAAAGLSSSDWQMGQRMVAPSNRVQHYLPVRRDRFSSSRQWNPAPIQPRSR